MDDPNTIAWLRPAINSDLNTWEAIRMNTTTDIPEHVGTTRSRESTAPADDLGAYTEARIHLKFDTQLKSGLGLMFGTDPERCDVVLPRLRLISRRHCYLSFDSGTRLVLQDFSTHGTVVKYDKKGGQLRRHFKWILGGHSILDVPQEIEIDIQGISFRIDVASHNEHPDAYKANVDRFMKGANEILLSGLNMRTPTPKLRSTPAKDLIRIERKSLGKGAYAVVHHYWDVSTGEEFAYKEPNPDRKEVDKTMWRKEIDILRSISHDHIVALLEHKYSPKPLMVLEYVPLGTLEGSELSLEESMTVLYQGLSALTYLHGQTVPIVHRDIKPANILVQSLKPLHVKLADFGFSRISADLTTICGTPVYMAPEIFHHGRSYTPAVDIWSLGLVAYECAYNIPFAGNRRVGTAWCKELVAKINDEVDGDLVNLLTRAMVIMDPKMRSSAETCYEEASKFVTDSEKRRTTPTPRSYNARDNKASPTRSTGESEETSEQEISKQEPSTQDLSQSPAVPSSKRAPSSSLSSSARNLKRHRYPTSSSRSDLNPFNSNWFDDPNVVGSEVAAMGKEVQESSDWTTDPEFKSDFKSKSKSEPRTMPDNGPQVAQTNANDESTLDAHAIAIVLGTIEAPGG